MVSEITAEEALSKLPAQERAWIEQFRDRVRAHFGARLKDMRLFGSKARGDWHEESDIDLLVLVESATSADDATVFEIAHSISSWLTAFTRDFDAYHSPISRASGVYIEMRKESVRL